MTYVINTNESVNELALAIYDDRDEILREVQEDDLVFPVYTGRRLIKRLYLIGELLYDNPVEVKVMVNDQTQYNVKVVIGKDSPRFSDFTEYTDTHSTSYKSSSSKFMNALPVDIYVESLGISSIDVEVSIEISAGAL